MVQALDLTGQRFGLLTVIERAPSHKRKTYWTCKCDCGNTITTVTVSLRHTGKTSCGCDTSFKRSTRVRTHNKSKSPAYKSWTMMKYRCLNPNYTHYKYYGGRGIGICQEWIDSFETFYRDMGDRPEGLTLDRIDTDKGYCKENCKWSTRAEQIDNRRNKVFLTHAGHRMYIKDWATVLGVTRAQIYLALYHGATLEGFIQKRGLAHRVPK